MVWPPVAGGAAATVGWLAGVRPESLPVVGVAVAGLVAAAVWWGRPEPWAWPDPVGWRAVSGGWYQVRRLTTTIEQAGEDPSRFDVMLRPRLQELAHARLTDLGVGWGEQGARDRLGADLHDVLDAPGHWPPARGGLPRSPAGLVTLVLDRLGQGTEPGHGEGADERT
ncbi:MAG: hypothetical protein ACRDWI_00585 [Jiangellaceae bacterium]